MSSKTGYKCLRIIAIALMLPSFGCGKQVYGTIAGEKKKHAVIMIQKNRISPSKITVKRGSTVIWLNGTSGTFLNISFTAGKKVQGVCSSSKRFFLNDEGIFVSGMIPPGAVASLCFLRAGNYNFMVQGINRFEYGTVRVID